MEAIKIYKRECLVCRCTFKTEKPLAGFCSPECRRERKHQKDKEYRSTEHGQAVRRKNRKSPTTLATRKRYEQTQKFKDSKHARNKIYMQGQHAKELEKVRKLNYYYSHFSKKFNCYDKNAHKVTLEEIKELYSTSSCFYCNSRLQENEKTVDHKLPVSRGGTNDMNNLVICCKSCNSKKNNQTEDEYRRAI